MPLIEMFISKKQPSNFQDMRNNFSIKYYSRPFSHICYWEQLLVDYVINPIREDEKELDFYEDNYWDMDYEKELFHATNGSQEERVKAAENYFIYIRKRYNENLQDNIRKHYDSKKIEVKTRVTHTWDNQLESEEYNDEIYTEPKPKRCFLGSIDFPPDNWDYTNAGLEGKHPTLYSIGKYTPYGYRHPNEVKPDSLERKVNITIIIIVIVIVLFILLKIF